MFKFEKTSIIIVVKHSHSSTSLVIQVTKFIAPTMSWICENRYFLFGTLNLPNNEWSL